MKYKKKKCFIQALNKIEGILVHVFGVNKNITVAVLGDGYNNNYMSNNDANIGKNNNGIRQIRSGGRERGGSGIGNGRYDINNNRVRSCTFHRCWIGMRSSSSLYINDNNINNDNDNETNIRLMIKRV